MRMRWVGIAVAVGACLAGCGGSGRNAVREDLPDVDAVDAFDVPDAVDAVDAGDAVDLREATVADLPDAPDAPDVPDVPVNPLLPPMPLRTEGRFVVDAAGTRVKMVGVNWSGGHLERFVPTGLDKGDVHAIARDLRQRGFNTVRLTWSNQMVETNPAVADDAVAANADLKGLRALEVFDAVVAALAAEGVMVVLNNHMSDAKWCCSDTDGNEAWYTDAYPESAWLADWRSMVERYRAQPAVIAADLRNEPRMMVQWGPDLGEGMDWASAAERGGREVLSANPGLLVIVEGVHYASDLTGVRDRPIDLGVPGRLVYSVHDYAWFHDPAATAEAIAASLDEKWGHVADGGQAWTAPVWVGEFGSCTTVLEDGGRCSADAPWMRAFLGYLRDRDLDWSWWELHSDGNWGLIDPSTRQPWNQGLVDALAALIPATSGPGVGKEEP